MTADHLIAPLGRQDAATLPANARIFVYGAGGSGRRLRGTLERRYGHTVTGFIDSNRDSGSYDGLPVVRPESLLGQDGPDLVIVIASQYWPEMTGRLNGFTRARLFNGYFMAIDPEELAPPHRSDAGLAGLLPLRIVASSPGHRERQAIMPDAAALIAWLDGDWPSGEGDGKRPAGGSAEGADALKAALRHLMDGDLFFAAATLYRWLTATVTDAALDSADMEADGGASGA
ncbi:hypothetical protein JZU48_01500, partial [bacterium]|nr:hypothetical protein [bacterium]